MNALSLQGMESTAAAYDRLLVPAVLQPWTQLVMDAAYVRPGHRVLDVACGTGALAGAVAARVGAGRAVVGLDLNPGMLAVAAKTSREIEWREGDARALPFKDGSFDAVVSQFGLMFFADRERAVREMVRVLVPGGRLAVAVFDSLERNPAYEAMAGVFERVIANEVGAALRFPFALGDKKQLAELFSAAGFPSAMIASHKVTARFASVSDMVLADVKGWFPFAGIKLDENQVDAVIQEARHTLERFVTNDGTVEFPIAAHIVAAKRP